MLRPDPWQSDPIRQHGRARQIFSGQHERTVVIRGVGRQACRGFYLHTDPAWRTGIDVAVHDGAPASPRHVPGWSAVHGVRAVGYPQRRHALWRQSRRGADAARRAFRARNRTGAGFGHAGGCARRAARPARMSVQSAARVLTIWLWVAVAASLLAWILV